jgi:hypothetical protein
MANCRTSAENIKIEPVYASWEQQETFKVTCVADVADSLDGKYFTFSSPSTNFYCWIQTDAAVDPALSGKTAIPVAADTGDTAAELAALIKTAIDANANFHAVIDPCDSTSVIVMCKDSGTATDVADGLLTAATGFTFLTLRQGSKLELGALDGDIELALTEDLLDVTSHQTGTQILTALRTGRNIENIALMMKESDAAKLKAVIETSGVEYTPVGSGTTAVSAWGSEDAKAFANIATSCKKLVLHPIANADNVLSGDFCFWRAYPLLTGLTLSGENPRMISVEFKIIPDQLLVKQARQFVYGDHTQNFLAAP